MTNTILAEHFTSLLLELFTETFEQVHGMYLDRDTSLFTTLETITAEEASQPVGGKCATLAAQVEHIRFYLEVLEKHLLHQEVGKVDWEEIWRSVSEVTPTEWAASQERLKTTYQRVRTEIAEITWGADEMGEALAMVVHTAYHLGEIRQALCTLKP